MALKIYTAPDGGTWQYEEGTQPVNYVEAARKAAAKPAEKEAAPQNKARAAKTKEA